MLIGTALAMALAGPAGEHAQHRPARPVRGAVRLHLGAPTTTARRSRGITVNTAWYNTALGLAMLLGRFLPIIFVLALAGSLARQAPVPGVGGHAAHPPAAVRRHGRRRDVILVALTFFPALALGPLAEGIH